MTDRRIAPTQEDAAIIAVRLARIHRALADRHQVGSGGVSRIVSGLRDAALDYMHFAPEAPIVKRPKP